jgi:hypothetical protein
MVAGKAKIELYELFEADKVKDTNANNAIEANDKVIEAINANKGCWVQCDQWG